MAVATPFLAAARQGYPPHRSQNLDIRPCAVYIDRNNAYLAKRDRYIRDVVKKQRFDTIAVK